MLWRDSLEIPMSTPARLVWGILAAWTLLCLAPSNANAGPEVDAGMPNGRDDTTALQAKLERPRLKRSLLRNLFACVRPVPGKGGTRGHAYCC